jgi:hypothetical protein
MDRRSIVHILSNLMIPNTPIEEHRIHVEF